MWQAGVGAMLRRLTRKQAVNCRERMCIGVTPPAREIDRDGAQPFVDRLDARIPCSKRRDLARNQRLIAARDRASERLHRAKLKYIVESLTRKRFHHAQRIFA